MISKGPDVYIVGASLLDLYMNAQMSALGCEAEIICSIRALPVLTQR
jgi:hypothetical protein